jgi:hypothetical protein
MSDVEMFEQGDSEDEAQILEPSPIPVVDLVTESDASDDEVEILEAPCIPVVYLVTDSEDEVAPPSTPPLGDIVPMVTSEDLESEVEILKEIGTNDLSWEELHEAARIARDKVIIAWGKMQRTTKRTKSKTRASPERPSAEPEYFGFRNDREVNFTQRTGGFYEPGPSNEWLCLDI